MTDFVKIFKGKLLFSIFLVSYTLVHLNFERNYWLHRGEGAIWSKYGDSKSDPGVGEDVYWTKATWMIILVWLQALGMKFQRALAISFAIYGVELLLLFPLRIYTGLNVLLSVGMVIESFRNP